MSARIRFASNMGLFLRVLQIYYKVPQNPILIVTAPVVPIVLSECLRSWSSRLPKARATLPALTP